MTDLTWTIVDTEAEFCALQPEWDALAATRPNASFHHQFAWMHTAWRVDCKPRGMRLHIITARHEGRIVLIAPVCRDRLGWWRVARWMSPLAHGECDILTLPIPEAAGWVEQAWARIAADSFDLVRCRLLRGDSLLWPLVVRAPLCRAYQIDALAIHASRYRDFGHYLSTRSKGFRKDINQARSRLRREGKLCFRVVEDAAEFPSILAWIEEHKAAWFESRSSTSLHVQKRWLSGWRFIHEVVEIAHETGNVMLCELTVDGKRVAAALNFVTPGYFYPNTIAMDYAWEKQSPGRLLAYESVRWAFEHGISTIYLGPGTEYYKIRLSDSAMSSMMHMAVPVSHFGACYCYIKDFYSLATEGFITAVKSVPGVKTVAAVIRGSFRSGRFY